MTDATQTVRRASSEEFRAAMARFAAGVVVVTTLDGGGLPRGFTASSFCSVSLDPPLVLVCLANSADSFAAFDSCERFAVSVLSHEHGLLAERFATKGIDKFASGGLSRTPGGLPAVAGALVELECQTHTRHPAGDHTILIGQVSGVRRKEGAGTPVIYYERSFRFLAGAGRSRAGPPGEFCDSRHDIEVPFSEATRSRSTADADPDVEEPRRQEPAREGCETGDTRCC